MNITHKIEVFTPDCAREALAYNPNNRPLNEKRVRLLADAIERGEWMVNGETIIFSDTGQLLDGQHRLAAVVSPGEPIETLVVRGMPLSVFSTLDAGRSRTAGDALSVKGESNCKNLAAALKMINNYNTRRPASRDPKTNAEILELLATHPNIRNSVRFRLPFCPPVITATAHYIFDGINPSECEKFFDDLKVGAGLPIDDAVFRLRERLMDNRMAKAKLPPHHLLALFIFAWNARRQNKPVTSLRWRESGPTAQAFPIAK